MTPQEKETFRNSIPSAKQCDNGRRVLFTGSFDGLSDDELARLKKFGPSLFTNSGGNDVLINAQNLSGQMRVQVGRRASCQLAIPSDAFPKNGKLAACTLAPHPNP